MAVALPSPGNADPSSSGPAPAPASATACIPLFHFTDTDLAARGPSRVLEDRSVQHDNGLLGVATVRIAHDAHTGLYNLCKGHLPRPPHVIFQVLPRRCRR
eukprot:CAMPEP_0183574946 /NCGR_PEP_ID=MMETSP0371-20130417/134455_1 /TAXON_ID=268820 /ORGANISM="Peridinium aciculiferum, Strain PAER-2" /LENGTH=100 /DNA_ID=CAMNT_0025785057 /DNA_START=17 /DNA_END=317 /DNA_ORIENTATION=+